LTLKWFFAGVNAHVVDERGLVSQDLFAFAEWALILYHVFCLVILGVNLLALEFGLGLQFFKFLNLVVTSLIFNRILSIHLWN
jgi:hypothetical protein